MKKKKLKGSYITEHTDSGQKGENLARARYFSNQLAKIIRPEEVDNLRRELQEDQGDFTNCNNP